MRKATHFVVLAALAAAFWLVTQTTQAAEMVTFEQGVNTTVATAGINPPTPGHFDGRVPVDAIATHSGASDYSASGLNLGTAGYWFFNFDAATNSGSAPEANEVEALPSWIVVDKTSADPTLRTLADGTVVHTSLGGQTGWSNLTLPESSGPLSGVSGAVMAVNSAGDSANIFEDMIMVPGQTPDSFLMHVVVDNTNGDHPSDKRMKVRARTPIGQEVNMRLDNLTVDNNPDVYTFQFDGWRNGGGELRLQLRNNQAEFSGIGASIAGIMFDTLQVPEPSSAVLILLGGIGLVGRRRR